MEFLVYRGYNDYGSYQLQRYQARVDQLYVDNLQRFVKDLIKRTLRTSGPSLA